MAAPSFAREGCGECSGTGHTVGVFGDSLPCPACLDARADAVLARAVPIAAHKLLTLFAVPDGFGTLDMFDE
jgi:hypothetical protein